MPHLLRASCVALLAPALLPAQHAMFTATRDSVSVMATVIATRTAPALAGQPRSEVLVTQPMLMLRGARRRGAVQFATMLNAERWTMPDGEPVAGIWGEGFVDRRHPHTIVHEVMLTGERRSNRLRVSIAGGKGIVPFGTDDPMVRPMSKYPANHHFSQILERVQLVGAIRLGSRLAVEAATFNGDEPAGPSSAPVWRRFGDSRSARLSLWPIPTLEVQGSSAFVRSPEFGSGEGLDQQKSSASVRWTPARTVVRYAFVEWARTEERYRKREIIGYGTLLAELLARHRWLTFAGRLERTSRPEEERLLDPFRTSRPPTDLTIKGVTRWRIATLHAGVQLPQKGRVHGTLFAEVAHAHSTPLLRPILLDPKDIIGASAAWQASVGLRLGVGAMSARVGRYGAAASGVMTDARLTMPHDHTGRH